jgi:hypothetical protein
VVLSLPGPLRDLNLTRIPHGPAISEICVQPPFCVSHAHPQPPPRLEGRDPSWPAAGHTGRERRVWLSYARKGEGAPSLT